MILSALLTASCNPSDDGNRLAAERLDAIEQDPAFSARPPNTTVHRTTRTDECAGEGADWGGLQTSRMYRTHGSAEDAFRFVVRRMRAAGWSRDPERVPPYEKMRMLVRDFGDWTGQVSVRQDDRGYVDVTGSLDEDGICY